MGPVNGVGREVPEQCLFRLPLQMEGVKRVHDMHLWSLTTGVPIMSVHIDIESGFDCIAVTQQAVAHLKAKGIGHTTIQSH